MKEFEAPVFQNRVSHGDCLQAPANDPSYARFLWWLSFLRSEFNFVTARSYWCGSFRFWLDQHYDCFCSCHFHSIEMIREDFVEDPSVRRSWVQILQRSCFQPLFGIVAPAPCARVTREHRNVRLRLGLVPPCASCSGTCEHRSAITPPLSTLPDAELLLLDNGNMS